jgi:hypothetical protein
MAASDVGGFPAGLELASRRAYELGRLRGAVLRAGAVALLALPGLHVCNRTPLAVGCLAAFTLVVLAGHRRGEDFGDGTLSGALAGILPCVLPAAVGSWNPDACLLLMSSNGLGICAAGGLAAGVILGWRSRSARGGTFWGSALATLALGASIGCLPAGAIGFGGLALGVIAGGAPILVARRAIS